MKKEFNFKGAKRGARVKLETTKVSVTARLDMDVLSWLRQEAEKKGMPYQTLLNSILKEAMTGHRTYNSEEAIRKIVRDELSKKAG
jgi:predicted DNA binding CopG/RHH family protein